MQFVVPQFIDVEDKILGPLSVRQFIIIIIGTGLIFAAYRFADFSLFLVEAITLGVLTMAFAFLRVNGRPFHLFVLNFSQTLRKPKLRIWRRVISKEELSLPKVLAPPKQQLMAKTLPSQSRLSELALIVDTGGVYKQEDYS